MKLKISTGLILLIQYNYLGPSVTVILLEDICRPGTIAKIVLQVGTDDGIVAIDSNRKAKMIIRLAIIYFIEYFSANIPILAFAVIYMCQRLD